MLAAELSDHLACPTSACGLADFLLTVSCKSRPAPFTRVWNPTWDFRPFSRKPQLKFGISWDSGLVPGHAPCARFPATCKVIMLGLHWDCTNVHLCIRRLLNWWRDRFVASVRGISWRDGLSFGTALYSPESPPPHAGGERPAFRPLNLV